MVLSTDPKLLYNTLSSQTNPMRYNCKALYTLDEVAAQCKAAIMKASAPKPPCSWEEVNHLRELSEQGDEDAEFYLENPVLWGFAWENDLMIAA